jgi:hypothetical protein
LLIVVATAIVAVGVGLLILAVSHHQSAAYAGLVIPGWLLFTKVPPQRDRDMRPRTWTSVLTLPLSRLYDRMGDDMGAWCETRILAASAKPQWIADAAQYYRNRMGRVTDRVARADLDRWRDSIVHKISMARLIDLGGSPAAPRASLQLHPSTQDARKYSDDDLARLAGRLERDALNDLYLFLASAYKHGYSKMPPYPSKPPVLRKTRHTVRVLSAPSMNQ